MIPNGLTLGTQQPNTTRMPWRYTEVEQDKGKRDTREEAFTEARPQLCGHHRKSRAALGNSGTCVQWAFLTTWFIIFHFVNLP